MIKLDQVPLPKQYFTTSAPAPLRTKCIACASSTLQYEFSIKQYRIVRCCNCALLFLNPQPTDDELANIYDESYALLSETPEGATHAADLKRRTAAHYLKMIEQYRGVRGGTLLEVGCGSGDMLELAIQEGFQVVGTDVSSHACATAEQKVGSRGKIVNCGSGELVEPPESFDVIILADVIEHVRDPEWTLSRLRTMLRPKGLIFIVTPSMDSWSARLLRSRWMEFKVEHLTYFDRSNLQTLLLRCGFEGIIAAENVKCLSFEYVQSHFEKYPVSGLTWPIRILKSLLPKRVRFKPRQIVASGMAVMATKGKTHEQKLSVVVPAYNEAATLATILDRLVEKRMEGLETEIIVVESNSTDGTREIAERYESLGLIRLIKEDRPRGKGHATRTGLAACTGDIVLIQDADLEYDMEDYDALLHPILNGRKAFVLGARHGNGAFKMRHFERQVGLSTFLNFGHWIFTALVDFLFLLPLKDPMTMYKVFRRDCLYGLAFQCNRFDFDFELLVKLVRKGYRPIEIPVNYRSRSFESGKKVSIVRDPWTWLWALLRLRFTEVNPLKEIQRQRKS